MDISALTHRSAAGRAAQRVVEWAPRALPLVALIAFAATAAALGLLLTARPGDDSSQPEVAGRPSAVPFAVSEEVPTSFGIVAVKFAQLMPASPDRLQVRASVTLTNLLPQTIDYSPSQFRLITGKGTPVAPSESTIQAGTLQPDANISGFLTFVAPSGARQLWIEFRDPGLAEAILIDLQRTGHSDKDIFPPTYSD